MVVESEGIVRSKISGKVGAGKGHAQHSRSFPDAAPGIPGGCSRRTSLTAGENLHSPSKAALEQPPAFAITSEASHTSQLTDTITVKRSRWRE